jgi:GTP cyclohydrolase I
MKKNEVILFNEIMAAYCEHHMQQIHRVCVGNKLSFSVIPGGTYGRTQYFTS